MSRRFKSLRMAAAFAAGLAGVTLVGCTSDDDFERYTGARDAGAQAWSGSPPRSGRPFAAPETDPVDIAFVADVTVGGSAELEIFAPDTLYAFGLMVDLEGERGGPDGTRVWGVAPVFELDHFVSELPSNAEDLVLRPGDGRLLYRRVPDHGYRVFHCDGCSYLPPDHGGGSRRDPASNDELIATACKGSVSGLALTPSGEVRYSCPDTFDMTWYDAAGTQLVARDSKKVWCFGHGNTALRFDGVLQLDTGEVTSLVDMDAVVSATSRAFAARALEDGYWLVQQNLQPRRLHIAFDGTVTVEGTYPKVGDSRSVTQDDQDILDADGSLLTVFQSKVYRRHLDGEVELLYEPPNEESVEPDAYGHRYVFYPRVLLQPLGNP
jgi:hypothetical protein